MRVFHVFGALAQVERSLTQERVRASLAAARRRGRPVAIDAEKMAAVVAALEGGATKAAVCRTFGIKRPETAWIASFEPEKVRFDTAAIDTVSIEPVSVIWELASSPTLTFEPLTTSFGPVRPLPPTLIPVPPPDIHRRSSG